MVELGAIGLGVALEEEMQRLVAADRDGCRALDGGRRAVLGAQHAAGAERLDALVVAIDGASAVGDLGNGARLGAQHDGRGVDVAGFADRRVDQAARGGIDLDRLLAEQPARQVEIMDHHVAEQAARDLDVGHRRWAGVAAGDGEQLELADGAGDELLAQGAEARVEAAVEADQQRHARLLGDLEAGIDAGEAEVDRLLAEDRLAGLGRPLDQVGVGVGRAGDGQRRLGRRDLGAVFAGERLGGRLVDVDDIAERRAGMGGDVGGVDQADAAGAELAEGQHEWGIPVRVRREKIPVLFVRVN